jgi:hypothetical protein
MTQDNDMVNMCTLSHFYTFAMSHCHTVTLSHRYTVTTKRQNIGLLQKMTYEPSNGKLHFYETDTLHTIDPYSISRIYSLE